MRIPTHEECKNNHKEGDWVAFYHPQWGGYVGLAWMLVQDDGCFDVLVWHDGEFPRHEEPPREYHYCCSGQLRDMADLADKILEENAK